MGDTTLRQAHDSIKRRLARRTAVLAAPLLVFARGALGATPRIEVIRPWVRYTRTLESSAYFTLLNRTEDDDQLIAVTSPLAERCTIQKVSWKGLVMSLVDQPTVKVPAMSRLEFNPKSLRVTIRFAKAMDRAQDVPLTLTFAKAGQIEVKAEPTERQLGPPRGP
jgi:copper(I)-binding protein